MGNCMKLLHSGELLRMAKLLSKGMMILSLLPKPKTNGLSLLITHNINKTKMEQL